MDTTSREFFEDKYQGTQDPWSFASSPYELERYAAILGAIGDGPFRFAFEPACSVGVLTAMLAGRCERVLGMDVAQTAVDTARQRCQALPNVTIEQGSVEAAAIDDVDLLVLSELGYYFTADALRAWSARLMGSVAPGGLVLACHWLGASKDHVLGGDAVHEVLQEVAARQGLRLMHSERNQRAGGGFRLETWVKP